MAKVLEVSSSEFAGRFGQYAFSAQSEPVKVVNQKTGATLGYFVSERVFDEIEQMRSKQARALPVWELDQDLVDALNEPVGRLRPELDHLMDE
jgi:hypothetical protein